VNTQANVNQAQQGNQDSQRKSPKKGKTKSGVQELSHIRGNTTIQINFDNPNPNPDQNQGGPRLMVI